MSERAQGETLLMQPRSTSLSAGASESGVLREWQRPWFLASKLVPPRSPGLIDRPRLVALASELSSKKLAVIMAPSGFGKTSLAASWAKGLEPHGSAVAWLTIDPDDDDPPRFLFYLTLAMQRAAPRVGANALELIEETFLINPQTVLSSLTNDLTEVDEDLYVFLEDYHWVANPVIHSALAFFLKHAPSHTHVVLTTRTEPPLPLASLRANNELLEVDAAALRFDLEEAREFLEREKPGSLELADVKLLLSRTGGWPAALRIIVSTSFAGKDFGQYVRNMSGAYRPIDTYLAEMLDGLPDELVAFMLRTAILDGLCAPLCDVVTGGTPSQTLLESIEKRQLLLTALDHEGHWYRYHPLLAEYLRRRLASELGEEIPELHHRAAHWYASKELWTEAVQHAIAAGDTDQALSWINKSAMALVKKGDLLTLLAWQRLFPPAVMKGQPDVKLAIAWGLALAVRANDALQILAEVEHDLGTREKVERDRLACECQAVRAVALSLRDEGQVALPLARQCVATSNDPWTANVASNVVRYWCCKIGDLEEFYATPWIPYSFDDDRRNVFASVYRRCIQGIAEAQQLRLAVAERYYVDASHLAEEHVGENSVAAALPACLIARIRYEQGRVEEAEAMLIDRLSFINEGAMLECVFSAYLVMVRVAALRMNFDRALTLLERAENLGLVRGWGRLCAAVALERVRLHLQEDRINEGVVALEHLASLADRYQPSVDFAWADIQRFSALGRAYLASAQQRFDDAITTLEALRDDSQRVRNHYFALRVSAHLSVVRFKAGYTTEALAELRPLISVAAPVGIHQTFMDEGPAVGALLAAAQQRFVGWRKSDELAPYLNSLIVAYRSCYQTGPRVSPGARLAEPLTAREGAVLNLIAQGYSNKEIARNLAIAPETVKSHVRHIFTKLDVEKRAQAVARAQSLGIVTT